MLFKEKMDKYQVFSEVYLGVDKVVIGIPFKPIVVDETLPPDALAEQKALRAAHWHEHLAWRQYVESTIVQQFKCQAPKQKHGEWLKRFLVYSDDPNSDHLHQNANLLYTVRSGLTPKGIHVMNVEWNPSKLTGSEWGEMSDHLSLLLFNHYEELYEKGVVSHFEWFVDIPGIPRSELALIELGRRTITPYKGTGYAGKRGGKQVDTIYDKGGHLNQADHLTRIEVRINRRDLLFRDLVEMGIENPFRKSVVVTNEALQLIAQGKSQNLAWQLKDVGLYGAAKNRPAREKIKQRLFDLAPPWWKPDLYWATFQRMMLEFKPAFLGGSA